MTNWGSPPDSDDRKKGLLGARMNEGKMSSFGPSRAKATEQLLANLSQGGGQTGTRSPGVENTLGEGDPRASMIGWVDHLFDCLAKCEYDWNRSIDRQEMKVLLERPEPGSAGYAGAQGAKLVLKGRLSMNGWSMFVRAIPDSIESYALPSDRAISFTVNPGQFSRLFQIDAGERDGQFGWFLDNRPVVWDDIADLARELMDALIIIASGQANLEQPFTFLAKSQPAPSAAPQQPGPDTAAAARQHSAILGGLDTPATNAPPGARPGAPASHPQVILPSSPSPPPAAAQQQLSDRQPAPELMKPVAPPPKEAPAAKQVKLEQGFDLTIAAIDSELKSLSDLGSQAFAKQDTEGAELVLRRTAKIKVLRSEMVSTFHRWKASFDEKDSGGK